MSDAHDSRSSIVCRRCSLSKPFSAFRPNAVAMGRHGVQVDCNDCLIAIRESDALLRQERAKQARENLLRPFSLRIVALPMQVKQVGASLLPSIPEELTLEGLRPETTIAELKEMILERLGLGGISLEAISLLFAGKGLGACGDVDRTVGSYGIGYRAVGMCTVHGVIRVRVLDEFLAARVHQE